MRVARLRGRSRAEVEDEERSEGYVEEGGEEKGGRGGRGEVWGVVCSTLIEEEEAGCALAAPSAARGW